MDEFVRQQRGPGQLRGRVCEVVLPCLVIARLVVFQTEVRNLITEREQEMIFAVVCCAEQRLSFLHEIAEFLNDVRRCVQRFFAICGDIEIMRGR